MNRGRMPDRFRATIQFGFVRSQIKWRNGRRCLRTRDAGKQQGKGDECQELHNSRQRKPGNTHPDIMRLREHSALDLWSSTPSGVEYRSLACARASCRLEE